MLRRLLDLGKLALQESDTDRLLARAMDYLVEPSGVVRGMIILFDAEREIFIVPLRHPAEEGVAEAPALWRSLIDIIKRDKTPICQSHTIRDTAWQDGVEADCLSTKLSVVGVPLCHNGKIFGMVYLESRDVNPVFIAEIFRFTQSFTEFISPAAYRALERRRTPIGEMALQDKLRNAQQFNFIVGHDPKMAKIFKLVAQIADADATVLIKGENGTGKELIARALHCKSRRRNQSFVPINCGAMPENLLESELFGHVRGAFTGAIKDKIGWFECAGGGTIFLDEVSEMTRALQVKLLRILQTGEYSRVGSTEIRHCKVRVVAATNKDLQALVEAGSFREDVYYRLNVIEIELPPLRDRKGDIPLLTQHFLKIFGARYGKAPFCLAPEAERLLLAHHYPGNIRELENIIQRAVVLAEGDFIAPSHLPANLQPEEMISAHNGKPSAFKIAKQRAVQKFEREYILDCLRISEGNISHAAQTAGIDVKNFHVKMTKYGIDPHSFKRLLK